MARNDGLTALNGLKNLLFSRNKISMALFFDNKMIASVCLIAVLGGCGASDGDTYTLYRNSLVVPGMRVHIATFDTADTEAYNRDNCVEAGEMFQRQPNIKTRYWCEKGKFKK